MEVVRRRALKRAMIEPLDVARLDDINAVGGLQPAFDQKKTFLRNCQAKFFEQLRRDDRVRNARFIFEADEDKSFSRARTLPTDHVPRDANGLAVLTIRKIDRAPHILQMRPQESHWMRSNGEREPGIIGGQAFDIGHVRQWRTPIL